ncbi:MAG: ABC transporter ATP-binding protein [Deltaproteobacteria bacterium]|nr:ABC transporter ATP-binding protein [Deltaproteobacteria bacterium]
MSVIEVENLEKIYMDGHVEVRALRGVNLTIDKGEFTVLAGPSGSGKTTLLNIIGALDAPTTGAVRVDDRDLSSLSSKELSQLRRDKIGFVFQAYNLIPVLTGVENVEFILMIQGMDAKTRRQKAEEVLIRVGLTDQMHRRPVDMSGGQQQRVAVARAIVSEPAIVLADEPTANLDSKTAGDLLELMERLNADQHITFVFSSHDRNVIDRARRLVRLHDGQIADDGRSQGAA